MLRPNPPRRADHGPGLRRVRLKTNPLKEVDENVERVLEESRILCCKIRVVNVKNGKKQRHELRQLLLLVLATLSQLPYPLPHDRIY